jgi:type IV pilus assembly protein PilF
MQIGGLVTNRFLKIIAIIAFFSLPACVQVGNKPSKENLAKAADANTQLGAAYLQEGYLGVANEKLQKALRQNPKSVQANSIYALLLNELGKTKDAAKYFKKSLKLAPEDSQVLNNYGTFLCDQGEIDKAIEQFQKALLDPLYSTPEYAYSNAGACLLDVPDFERAKSFLRKALQRNKTLPSALYQMAKLNYLKGRYAVSKNYLDRFHQRSGKSAESLWLGIRLAWQLRDKDTASSFGLLLKNKYPDSAEAQKLLQAESTRR